MEKYESKQQQINHPASLIFPIISRMDLMSPAMKDKVEEWESTEDSALLSVLRISMLRLLPTRVVSLSTSHFGFSSSRSKSATHVCAWCCMLSST